MPITIRHAVRVNRGGNYKYDAHQNGLLDLAELFAAFDTTSLSDEASYLNANDGQLRSSSRAIAAMRLTAAHDSLSKYDRDINICDPVQYADFHITKSWMRTLLWQQAMNYGILSSHASAESMSFMFPSLIAKDLLTSLAMMSKDHLLPLGRDQVRYCIYVMLDAY